MDFSNTWNGLEQRQRPQLSTNRKTLTNKLLAAILAALVSGFGGVFLHWQHEANEKSEAAGSDESGLSAITKITLGSLNQRTLLQ
jgi:hypothetical protein